MAACIKCQEGFSLINNRCINTKVPECLQNQYLSIDFSKCIDCSSSIPSCESCNNYSETIYCNSCSDELLPDLKGAACNYCEIFDCMRCEEDGVCTVCSDGFLLNNDGECVSCPEKCSRVCSFTDENQQETSCDCD
jgi:hypothetical protein